MSSPKKDLNLECFECHKKWKTRAELARHVITHSDDRPYECVHEGCSYASKRPETLRAHMKKCPKRGGAKKTLTNGLTSDGYVASWMAKKSTSQDTDATDNQAVTLPIRPDNPGDAQPLGNTDTGTAPLSVVDEESDSSDTVRGADAVSETDSETDTDAGLETPSEDPSAQDESVKSESGESVKDDAPHFELEEPAHTFPCPTCTKKKSKAEKVEDETKRNRRLKKLRRVAWPTKSTLTRHLMRHRKKTQKTFYVCQLHECDATIFTGLEEFRGHQQSHPALEHACMSPECFYRLQTKMDLLEHLTTHKHETPYKCRLPNCEEGFKFYAARQFHEDNHYLDIAMAADNIDPGSEEGYDDTETGADGQTEEDESEESEESEEDPEDDPDDVEIDPETGQPYTDSESDGDDFLTADQKAELAAYDAYRYGLLQIDNQYHVAEKARKLAKVAMDKFETDHLFYDWLLKQSGKNFTLEQENMLEGRVQDAHDRYLGAKWLNEGSMRMDPLAMGQVEQILMEWVMDDATDAKGNVFKTIQETSDVKMSDNGMLPVIRDFESKT